MMLAIFLVSRNSPTLRKEVDAVLKSFFAAVILAVFMLSAQIVSAEDLDSEWYVVPYISNKAELFNHIEDERRFGHTTIYATFINGFKLKQLQDSDGKFMNLATSIVASIGVKGTQNADGTEEITLTIREYPGTRVANAYLHSNTDDLTMDEMELYEVAVAIVNKAKNFSSPIERARYIHDEICKRTAFELHKSTATHSLVHGKADCDGFTDTFYMLGRMCDLNVGRIGGISNGGVHAWNWIEFNGNTYFIDVTFDKTSNSYNWFLKDRAHMVKTHKWDLDMIPNMQ